MHTDARTLEDGTRIEGDLCIVGAGPAGISMALDWAGRSERVILLEGGGFEVSSEMQALYENTNSGRDYYPLESAR
ncbi:MAG: FAD/NAD(P)-binding oxidoreductase, partial [Salinibacter sp.]